MSDATAKFLSDQNAILRTQNKELRAKLKSMRSELAWTKRDRVRNTEYQVGVPLSRSEIDHGPSPEAPQ